MLKNIKIKKKLIAAFIFVMVLSSISGISSVFITANVNREYSFAVRNYGFAQGDVGKLLACFGSINVSVHDVVGYVDPEQQKAAQALFDSQIVNMDPYFSAVDATIQKEETRKLLDAAEQAWKEYLPLAQQLMKEGETTDIAVVQVVQGKLAQQLDPLYNTIYTSLSDLMASKVADGNQLEAELTRSTNLSILFVVIMIVVAFLISVSLSGYISNMIAKPTEACAKRLRDLAHGDLSSPVPPFHGKDEIGVLAQSTEEIVSGLNIIIEDEKYLLSEMANGNFDVYSNASEKYVGDFKTVIDSIRLINFRLSDTLTQINESSEQVSSGSEQVSSAAQNLSQGASEQASSIESLASTITEISQQVSSNAENATHASQKAQQVGTEMEKSNEKMQRMIQAMSEISSSSDEIGKIIKTIEDIAFQTNILALNAAVEAARAGAAGKGFAVVADEVRNLASKSAEASKNTAQLIETSVRAVENGTQIADDTAKALLIAVDGAREVVEIVEKISSASVEQSKSVEMVTQNLEQISGVIQTNSSTAEESAAASEELSSQASILKNLVGQFHLKDQSNRPALLHPSPSPAASSAQEYQPVGKY